MELFQALLNTLAQSAWTIYLANSGHWELQEDGYSLGYENTAPGCGPLLGSLDPGLWRYSSNTGFTMQIRLRSVEAITSLPYFVVKLSCICLMFVYRTKAYSYPKVAYKYPKVT